MSTTYKNEIDSIVVLRKIRKNVPVNGDVKISDDYSDDTELNEALERGWLSKGQASGSDDDSDSEQTSSTSNKSTSAKKSSSPTKAAKPAPKSTTETDPGSGTSTDVSGS